MRTALAPVSLPLLLAACLGGPDLEQGEAAVWNARRHLVTIESQVTNVRIDDPSGTPHTATMSIQGLLDLQPVDTEKMTGTFRLCSIRGGTGGTTITGAAETIAAAPPATLELQRDQEGMVLTNGFSIQIGGAATDSTPADGVRHSIQTTVMSVPVSIELVLSARLEVTGWWPTWTEQGGLSGRFAARDALQVVDTVPPGLAEVAQSFLNAQRAKFRITDKQHVMTTTPLEDANAGCP